MLEVKRAVTDHIAYDSEVERQFASDLDKDESVRVFAKLPGWFKVPTPLGSYNPDWAVLVSGDGGERLYLVVETKGTVFLDELRASEAGRIRCGERHFKAIAAAGLHDGAEGRSEVAARPDLNALQAQPRRQEPKLGDERLRPLGRSVAASAMCGLHEELAAAWFALRSTRATSRSPSRKTRHVVAAQPFVRRL